MATVGVKGLKFLLPTDNNFAQNDPFAIAGILVIAMKVPSCR